MVRISSKLGRIFEGEARYRGAFGGRGSGKSRGFAIMAIIRSINTKLRILCVREYQSSIKDSVLKELKEAIDQMGVHHLFDYGENYLRGKNGSEFIFKGLINNVSNIKSISGVDICWAEEADRVSEKSWQFLIPTIRKPGSEIWITWNPEVKD